VNAQNQTHRRRIFAISAVCIVASVALFIFCIHFGITSGDWPWPLILVSLLWIVWPVLLTNRELRRSAHAESAREERRERYRLQTRWEDDWPCLEFTEVPTGTIKAESLRRESGVLTQWEHSRGHKSSRADFRESA
jgi:fatty acid desaturase